MVTQNRSTVTAALLAFAISGAPAFGWAQAAKATARKQPQRQEGMQGMKGMKGMDGMMEGPHHVLAMAYRDNLVTFAKALRSDVTQSKVVTLDVARPALAEMRRNYDQMRQHHQAQVAAMRSHPDTSMAAMMTHSETHLAALNEHLTALEAELNGTAPNAGKVAAHATEIVKECAGMSAMHAKSAPGHQK